MSIVEETPAAAANLGRPATRGRLLEVLVDQCAPAGFNPRAAEEEDAAAFEELVRSVELHGVLQPILLRYWKFARHGGPLINWGIIAGERRWRAAKAAGLEKIPAYLVESMEDYEAVECALIENLQRSGLSAIAEARGYQVLIDLGRTQLEIAERCGKSQPSVSNALALLKLPEDAQGLVGSGKLTPFQATALARFAAHPAVLSKLADVAAKYGTPRKQLERGLPHAHELQLAGLAVPIAYSAPFRQGCVDACPFSACVREGSVAWCLFPEHYRELEAAAREEQEQRSREAAERARAAVQAGSGLKARGSEQAEGPEGDPEPCALSPEPASPLPVLGRDLAWGAFTDLAHYPNLPDGCSEACHCRGVGQREHDGSVVAICTQPERFRSLVAAANERAREGRREVVDQDLREAHCLIDGAARAWSLEREVGMACTFVLRQLTPEELAPIVEAVGLDIDPRRVCGSAPALLSVLGVLEKLKPAQALALAVLGMVRQESAQWVLYGGERRSEVADWYLGRAQAPAVEEEQEPAPPGCESCGALAPDGWDDGGAEEDDDGNALFPSGWIESAESLRYCPACVSRLEMWGADDVPAEVCPGAEADE